MVPIDAGAAFSGVSICNKGKTRLVAATLTFVRSTLGAGNAERQLGDWWFVEPGKCVGVYGAVLAPLTMAVVNVGFLEEDADGNFHPAKFSFAADMRGDPRFVVDRFCVGAGRLRLGDNIPRELRGACGGSTVELETSATAAVSDGEVELTVSTNGSDERARPPSPVPAGPAPTPVITRDAQGVTEISYGAIPCAYVIPVPTDLVDVDIRVATPCNRGIKKIELARVYKFWGGVDGVSLEPLHAARAEGAKLLTCAYGVQNGQLRVLESHRYWYGSVPKTATVAQLRTTFPKHPMLLIEGARTDCPPRI